MPEPLPGFTAFLSEHYLAQRYTIQHITFFSNLLYYAMTDLIDNRDDILETLEAIEEQLTAVPHKREEVKDQLQTIAQAKRVAYPIANLYANVWSLRGRKARASREILSALGLDPDLASHLEPGMEVTVPNVDAGPYEDLTLHGTVNEEGVMCILDVERVDGTTIDRDEWMGRYHDYFGLLATVHVALKKK